MIYRKKNEVTINTLFQGEILLKERERQRKRKTSSTILLKLKGGIHLVYVF